MLNSLNDWERKHFVDGGGEPFLFYVVYGEIDSSIPLSGELYRSEGIPSGIDVMSYSVESDVDVIASFRKGYVWDKFVARNPEFAAQVESCQSCIILRGTPTESKTLNYLRDTVGLVTFMLDNGGCAVFDPQVLRWWGPSEWKSKLFDPSTPVPTQHVVILKSEERSSKRFWFHTRGMRKFGRPDISLHDVTEENAKDALDIINQLISTQAFGEVFSKSQQRTTNFFSSEVLVSRLGGLGDLDFNNYYLELSLKGT